MHWFRTYVGRERPLLLVIVILADFTILYIRVCALLCVRVCVPLLLAFTARCKCIFISCLCARVFINETLISDFSPSLSLFLYQSSSVALPRTEQLNCILRVSKVHVILFQIADLDAFVNSDCHHIYDLLFKSN